jgi:F-type H+-transporting ATPase subunit a
MDPIHQFAIKEIFPVATINGHTIAFTNSALFMFIAVGLAALLMIGATASRAVIPGRWQSVAEGIYEFVASTVRSSAGQEGMRFFPLVFSLFIFVLIANLLGLIPGFFTVTSHIIVTFTLAVLVIGTVIIYGFYKNGTHFLNLFVPTGVPVWLLPLMVAIEVISFVSRPISLSVRLFANMLAGHIALKIFASFVVALAGAGLFAVLSPLPLVLTVALVALEFLVAVLQAYVFATLTCIYLNDALHPGH